MFLFPAQCKKGNFGKYSFKPVTGQPSCMQVESESNLTGKKWEDLWLKAFDDYVSICGRGSEELGCGRGGGDAQ